MRALVQYAGYEPPVVKHKGGRPALPPEEKLRRVFERKRIRTASGKMFRAYNMFKAGYDTMQIAAAVDRSEATVLFWITTARSKFRGLPSPYEGGK